MLFVLFSVFLSVNTISALTDKALKKECKTHTKQLKKEGWTVFGSAKPLEAALTAHYERRELMAEDDILIIGRGTAFNENQARARAHTDAATQYATMCSVGVTGNGTASIENTHEGEDVKTTEVFTSTTQMQTEQNVRGLQPALTLTRKLDDGKSEMMIYYITKVMTM